MTIYNSQENKLIITIPNKGISDLQSYRRTILGLLAKVEIENCNPDVKSDLKLVYELLSHLYTDEDFINNESELSREVGSNKSKQVVLQT